MAIYRFQSQLLMTSNIPADAAVNIWHYTDSLSPADHGAVVDAWESFMVAIKGLFPATVATTAHVAKIYDLDDPEPRAPILQQNWSLGTAASGNALPSEVSLCLSYEGARVSGQDQKRRRGRMYLGPLDTGTCTAAGRPEPAGITTIQNAFLAFLVDMDAANAVFGVYSRSNDVLVVPATAWVDNAFDVQRRRGLDATERNTLSLS